LVIAVLFAAIAYAVVGVFLDKLSGLFARGSVVHETAETLLAILAPMTFGFLILLVLVVSFYVLLPRWFPRLAKDGGTGTSTKN
jgi:Na+-driven multidrug efflux pump